jgi:hypothetical protein
MEPQVLVESAENTAVASVVRVPQRWLRFLRKCLHLRPGRYMIVVSVYSEECDWSIIEAGKVEH